MFRLWPRHAAGQKEEEAGKVFHSDGGHVSVVWKSSRVFGAQERGRCPKVFLGSVEHRQCRCLGLQMIGLFASKLSISNLPRF